MRRAVTLLVVVVGAIVVPVAGRLPRERVTAPPATYANPAIDDATANPFVLGWGQLAYAYVDGRDVPDHQNVPAYVTGDLADWRPLGDVLPDAGLGAWMRSGSGDARPAVGSPAVASFPDNPVGSRFVLYFTATATATGTRTDRSCIGVATADAPTGPFRAADEPLLCPPGGARDPSPVTGTGGAVAQLAFRQEGAAPGIYGQRLGPDGTSLVPQPPAPLLLDDDAGGLLARPSVLALPGDHALLLFSFTTADAATAAADAGRPGAGGRTIGWARCATTGVTTGTTTGTGGPELGSGVSAPLVTACVPAPGGAQWLGGSEAVESPGAPQVFGPATERWIAYDAFAPGSCAADGCDGPRRMHVDELCVDDGGVPRTAAPTVAPQTVARDPACRTDVAAGWVATWAAGFTPASPQFGAQAGGFADQTLRQVVHTSVGGAAVRVRVSNTYGTVPLSVGRATVGLAVEPAGGTGAIQPASLRPLTFGGAATVVVPPGGDVVSDAVALEVLPDHDLAVSLWFPRSTGPPNGHLVALETSYVAAGDRAADPGPGFARAATTTSAFFVSAVDVRADRPVGTVALLGDSLTDGAGGLIDGERRWSDLVVDRLAAAGALRRGVVNVGIAGNTLLPNRRSTSPGALTRFDHDVLAQADVDTVVVLLGTNDLMGDGTTAVELLDGLRQLIERGHAAGVRVVGATIPPLAGPDDPPAPAPLEQARAEVNARIRPGSADALGFDAVVDMDAALRDPADPTRVRPAFSWLGGFHPNEAGHQAMADGLDLSLLGPDPAPGPDPATG